MLRRIIAAGQKVPYRMTLLSTLDFQLPEKDSSKMTDRICFSLKSPDECRGFFVFTI